ncbi:hypothetical protein BDP81DRAFT_404137 [Colletotrichum phormii]|uniref:Uncharacterized protein n=1 Tax=Colletotrichum phormii TaxID=359342 RepID=A0AAI9ZYV0_9PEZI|nr:uncharacterized protein BDP81DRAFT_404137 [Colletotrichum phormii]KAK1639359.1 hypothetical protein BDP81DRAFT_404137 [Colletotrichum phormii]
MFRISDILHLVQAISNAIYPVFPSQKAPLPIQPLFRKSIQWGLLSCLRKESSQWAFEILALVRSDERHLNCLADTLVPQIGGCRIAADVHVAKDKEPSPWYLVGRCGTFDQALQTAVSIPARTHRDVASATDFDLFQDMAVMKRDGLLSRESWAYKHLYQKNLTGPPNITAQYYGTWAVKFPAGKTPEGRDQYKTVALILMEYIDGYSIDDLCNRDEYGDLVPDDELP